MIMNDVQNDRIKARYIIGESLQMAEMGQEVAKRWVVSFFYEIEKEMVEKVKRRDKWMYQSCAGIVDNAALAFMS